ncbi:hypothetical protein [Caldisalinibacter kiritimatiensis]|uniref:Uncharacterized protein n=1 Tax=Caldisalinibacter kiritimatiensis TaxID=1304284 RepID=R1AT32_9FIRM|nr:hypothetical protein [Caldisalinibacter kiritimatiensis]EOD00298.1 hypothetical protein L21TH_1658 [Caldisalinibacter kiritimatiensis]
MEKRLINTWFVKYVVPFLIICIFLIQTSFMIYEYINWSGYNSFNNMDFVNGGPIKYSGDSTVFFQHEMKIPYSIYRLVTLIVTVLCIIDLVYRNKKVSVFTLSVWSVLLVLNMSWMPFLLQNMYLLSLPVYYEAFITMQFIPIKKFILRIFFGIYVLAFITYTGSYIKNCLGAIKELRK